MSARLSTGLLTISIDLDADATRIQQADQRVMDDVTGELLDVLRNRRLPATWAVVDPAISAATQRILSASADHEIAILGDPTWVGRDAPRSRFARELARRADRSRSVGVAVSTLVLNVAQLDQHCDLAIKHGITAVRHAPADARSARALQPQTLQYGLWSFPVSVSLPGTSRWLPGGGGGRRAQAIVDQAIMAPGLVHLAIDAPRLAALGSSSRRVLDRVLRHVDRRRSQGVLDVASIGGLALRLAGQYQSQPSRSILHCAA
jgi:hypothetical protein